MALRTYLTGIADAIREKKGTSDPINAQDFASEISSISTGGSTGYTLQELVDSKGKNGGAYLCYFYAGTSFDFLNNIDFSKVTNMEYMFRGCYNATTILPQIDTSQIINMQHMFEGCQRLTSIPQWDTNKVTNMTYMFAYCYELTTIPQLNLSSASDLSNMFKDCTKLTTLPPLNTSSATNMRSMFSGCWLLQNIDITKLVNNNYITDRCSSLTKFVIRTMDTLPTFGTNMFNGCYHMTGATNATYNPEGLDDGRIYVPDDKVDALKAATGWSTFADNIVPLSTLVED